jgi:hypothetical protein
MSLFLAQASSYSPGTGIEFMIALSILLPIIVLIVIFWLGSRNTV